MNLFHCMQRSLLVLMAIICLTAGSAIAQKVKNGYLLSEFKQAPAVIPFNERFQFEEFKNGFVYKRTGARSAAKLNYSYLYGDILFLGSDRDTLTISDKEFVKYASIGENIYFYDQKYGYAEIVSESDGVKVGKQTLLALLDFDKSAHFEKLISPVFRPDQTTLVGVSSNVKAENLSNLRLKSQSNLFFIDQNNRFYAAGRNSLLKIHRKIRRKVIHYLDERVVNYDNEDDLKTVIADCAKLAAMP